MPNCPTVKVYNRPFKIVDSFTISSRTFDYPVKVVLRDDHVVELYAIEEDGTEQYAGLFGYTTRIHPSKFDIIKSKIQDHVRGAPVSQTSLSWLQALDRLGLLPS